MAPTVVVDNTQIASYNDVDDVQCLVEIDMGTAACLTLRGDEGQPVLLQNCADPTTTTDAATKGYVDTLIRNLATKEPVLAATMDPLRLTDVCAGLVMDGDVRLRAGDRVLLMGQSDGQQNGLYVVADVGAAAVRCSDLAEGAPCSGVYVLVRGGQLWASHCFVCPDDDIVVGRDAMRFVPLANQQGRTAGLDPGVFGCPARRPLSNRLQARGSHFEVDFDVVPSLRGPNQFLGDISITASTPATSQTSAALTVRGGVGISGDLFVRSTIHLSDRRAKCAIRRLPGCPSALARLCRVHGRLFRWRGRRKSPPQPGLIAQEIRRCLPLCVACDPATGLFGIDHGRLMAYVVEAIGQLARQQQRHRRVLSRMCSRTQRRKKGPDRG